MHMSHLWKQNKSVQYCRVYKLNHLLVRKDEITTESASNNAGEKCSNSPPDATVLTIAVSSVVIYQNMQKSKKIYCTTDTEKLRNYIRFLASAACCSFTLWQSLFI